MIGTSVIKELNLASLSTPIISFEQEYISLEADRNLKPNLSSATVFQLQKIKLVFVITCLGGRFGINF